MNTNKIIKGQIARRKVGAGILTLLLPLISVKMAMFLSSCGGTSSPTNLPGNGNGNGYENGNGNGGQPIEVQREFNLPINFYYLMPISGAPDMQPGSANVKIVDKTNGNSSLQYQNTISKLNQAFEQITYRTSQEGVAAEVDRERASRLNRGITINVINEGEAWDGFRAINHNTVEVHINFLQNNMLEIDVTLARVTARILHVMPTLPPVPTAQQIKATQGQQNRANMLAGLRYRNRARAS